jgi:SAM-dependent methyltransferase
LLGKNVALINPTKIDFEDESFDLIVASRPEHIDDDRLFFTDTFRVIRPGGMLVVTSPHDERLLVLNDVKERIGLTMEQYDHYRRGYSGAMLRERLSQAGFDDIHVGSYCRFFSEFIEMSLNAAYVFVNKGKARGRSLRDLSYRPTSRKDMQSNKVMFALYKMAHPVLFLISRLDKLLFFTNGYVIFATARRP